MSVNQEEKIKDILTKNGRIELKEILLKLSKDISKQTFYNKIRKMPLDQTFIDLIKTRLNIDLDKELIESGEDEFSPDYLRKENIRLHRLMEDILMKGNADKDKIIELQEKIDLLKDKYERKQG